MMDDFEKIVDRPSTARNAPAAEKHLGAWSIAHLTEAIADARFLGEHATADGYIDLRDYLLEIFDRYLRAEAGEGRDR